MFALRKDGVNAVGRGGKVFQKGNQLPAGNLSFDFLGATPGDAIAC
jgi:hypothetical protein